jgi:trimethylamine--corrinoid protein Co-methyltransferase
MDAFQEVGPGSHFLGSQHTLRNYQTAFWDSELSDNEPFEKWSEEGGSTDMATRANKKWKRALENYEAPPLDQAIDDALQDYMNRKKTEVADAWH